MRMTAPGTPCAPTSTRPPVYPDSMGPPIRALEVFLAAGTLARHCVPAPGRLDLDRPRGASASSRQRASADVDHADHTSWRADGLRHDLTAADDALAFFMPLLASQHGLTVDTALTDALCEASATWGPAGDSPTARADAEIDRPAAELAYWLAVGVRCLCRYEAETGSRPAAVARRTFEHLAECIASVVHPGTFTGGNLEQVMYRHVGEPLDDDNAAAVRVCVNDGDQDGSGAARRAGASSSTSEATTTRPTATTMPAATTHDTEDAAAPIVATATPATRPIKWREWL
jgi:hypothetical protein